MVNEDNSNTMHPPACNHASPSFLLTLDPDLEPPPGEPLVGPERDLRRVLDGPEDLRHLGAAERELGRLGVAAVGGRGRGPVGRKWFHLHCFTKRCVKNNPGPTKKSLKSTDERRNANPPIRVLLSKRIAYVLTQD